MVPDALTDGPRFAAFNERYIVHTKGRWARQPLVLEEWQREFWWEALEVDPTTGLRVYNEVGLGIPRKNGKSVMASGAGHYFLVADGEDEPDVYVAAAAKNQAGIVLNQSRRMALQSPRLLRLVSVQKHLIECPRNGGTMRAISADAALQHGLNPHASIIDELHAHRSPDLYTALQTGTGAREQPFLLWISTAGAGEGVLRDIYRSMFAGREGVDGGPAPEVERRGFLTIFRDRAAGRLIYWYAVPDDADFRDPAVWAGVNPASWLQDGRFLQRQYLALRDRGALADFRMYHLNQWVDDADPWMDPDLWGKAAGAVRIDRRAPVRVVVRISHDHRTAAIAVAQRQGDRVALTTQFLQAPAGQYVDSGSLEKRLMDLHRSYPSPVHTTVRFSVKGREYERLKPGPEVMYHGAFLEGSAQRLAQQDVVMHDLPNTPERLRPAAEALMKLLVDGLLTHDGSPELAHHLMNVAAKPAPTGWAISALEGSSGPQPILLAQAAMLAVHRAVTAPAVPKYRTRGL